MNTPCNSHVNAQPHKKVPDTFTKITRRQAIQALASATLLTGLGSRAFAQEAVQCPPVRTITRGPQFHWFGYYDKLEFDPTDRYVLSNKVAFEHRTPRPDDAIEVGMVDTHDNDTWHRLGSTTAWGWQQGCMLQWRPGSDSQVIWNERSDDGFTARILDVTTGESRTIPKPAYTLSPDGRYAITADFARIQRMRPGYGYNGGTDPDAGDKAPEGSGVWRIDLDTGEFELIFSLAEAAAILHQGQDLRSKWNYFNHLLINPSGTRFIVLHRWRNDNGNANNPQPAGGWTTRMFTVSMDGTDRRILDPSGNTSHFIWRDDQHICAWTRALDQGLGYYLFDDESDKIETVGQGTLNANGHITYLPHTDNEWLLLDTYPDRARNQTPYLYHIPSSRRVNLGVFNSPQQYSGEWRCDTHPRASNDGKTVAIDSPHAGGRQVHLIDVSQIVGE